MLLTRKLLTHAEKGLLMMSHSIVNDNLGSLGQLDPSTHRHAPNILFHRCHKPVRVFRNTIVALAIQQGSTACSKVKLKAIKIM